MGRLTHTVSGSIATVRSPAVAPIESLKVHFSPIQEGTGDPSPSNVRPITGWTGVTGYKAGKNLIDYNTLTIFDIGDDYGERRGFIFTKPGTYYVKALKTWENNSYIYCRVKNADGTYNNIQYFVAVKTVTNRTITIGSGQTLLIFNSVKTTEPSGTIEATIERFDSWGVVVSFNDVDSYEPYSGETIPVTFPAVGKNLFPIGIGNEIFVNNGNATHSENDGKLVITTNASSGASGVYIKSTSEIKKVYDIIEPPFTISMDIVASETGNVRIVVCGSQQVFEVGTSKQRVSVTATSKTTMNFNIYGVNNGATLTVSDLQIEKGSTATAYEPYTNTAYGGYVDLATGDVYKEYKRIIYDGSEDENWRKLTSGSATAFGMYMGASDKEKALYSDISSNYLKTISHNATWGNYDNWISDNVSEIATGIQSITTVSAWKEYLSEHNLVVCYKLKTPLKIATLTPQELATFKGYSNFWSNAGDVDVTYQVVESSEMTKERQKIFAGNAPSIHTVSGSVANFNMEPGLNRNLKSCKVGFLPVQEGSGDSSLTNVRHISGWSGITAWRTGKNLLNPVVEKLIPFEDASYNHYSLNNGVITTTGNALAGFVVSVKPSTRYTFSFTKQGNANLEIFAYAKIPDKIRNSDQMIAYQNQNSVDSFTIPSDCNYIVCAFVSTISSNVISEFQLELGSTASPYTEYTGSSYPITFPTMGKNLLNPASLKQGGINGITGADTSLSTRVRSDGFIPVSKGEALTLSAEDVQGIIFIYDEDGNFVTNEGVYGWRNLPITQTFNANRLVRVTFKSTDNETITPEDVINPQLEKGSTATDYEPFTNTVYGGTVYPLDGRMLVEWKTHTFDGSENISKSSVVLTGGARYNSRGIDDSLDYANLFSMSDKMVAETTALTNISRLGYRISSGASKLAFYVPDGILQAQTVENFIEWLSVQKPVITYKLATPYEIQLTPTQIQALKGTNNILSDANGIIEVKYWSH